MRRKTSRTHARGEESRQRILYAALEIAVRRGYDGTTIGAVSAATGLPASSLYWHFENKDQLLAAALDLSYRRWRHIAPSWNREAPDGSDDSDDDSDGSGAVAPPRSEQIEAQLRQAATGFARQPGFWRFGLMLALEQRPVEPAARTRFLQIRTEVVARIGAWWEGALAAEFPAAGLPDVSPEVPRQLAQLTLAAMDGLFIAGQGRTDLDTDAVVRRLAAGLDGAAVRLTSGSCAPVEGPVPAPRARPPGAVPPAAGATSRERVLRAAAEIAAERGYEGATISRVCARAGLPPTSVYWAFDDKDELLAAAVEHSFEEWLAERPAWPVPPADGSWPDALRAHLGQTLRSLSGSPNFLRIGLLLLLQLRETTPEARAVFLRIRRSLDERVAGWFGEALGETVTAEQPELPRRLATLLMAFSDGLFLSHQLDGVVWHPDLFADLLVTAFESASRSTVGTTSA
ncbi:TetR/AcrR family transcriptional regulator [Pseudonocardia parietis]|uniref:AcrR family transcriptional regulator n=1 Tax=Pseudonocardia parietis TaxID=570936 RepID=A0ABS4VZB1_9PSEU|nr:TetR/AcrR family transcriptional regulator [Pseudonocardia parietis]MBP2369257.1 AcrR family transcriptional regulator [Pseudonocardia parietis]